MRQFLLRFAIFHAFLVFCTSSVQAEPMMMGGEMMEMDSTMDSETSGHETMNHNGMPMSLYGSYSPTREASGTAWQPDSTPMEGAHFSAEEWNFMVHGYVTGIYNNQGGKRGDEKGYSTSMGMLMGSRKLGEGTLGFRSMLSLDAMMGKSGYPELLQTGETANGTDELTDRQHPHDLFMEMALTYSLPLTEKTSVFIYGGLPGEPAIGPAAFMHRASGDEIPDAPITHHWLDSTHITEGVVTLGYVLDEIKLEGSIFNGREPDQNRYNIETRQLDSYSGRLSYNPSENWTTQISFAYLDSPEQIHPEIETRRTTVSATYNLPFAENNWATTLAWGQNRNSPGRNLNGLLLESELVLSNAHTVFARVENVQKDELFSNSDAQSSSDSYSQSYLQRGSEHRVTRIGAGYIYDFITARDYKIGIGGEGELEILRSDLHDAYGDAPFSFLLFLRAKII